MGAFGPRLTALIALLHGRYRHSTRETAAFLGEVCGVDISLGSVITGCNRVSAVLAPTDAELQATVQAQPHLWVDETSWRDQQQRGLWVAVSPVASCFRVDPSRGQHALRGLASRRPRSSASSERLRKLAHGLIERYDRIALEDLRITNRVRNPHLAKSILEAGWGYLVQHLTSKAEEAGRVVCLIDPRYTPKSCSQCGHVFEALSLSDRWIECGCGLSLDRDHNAAINILKRAGQVRWGISSPVGGLLQEAVPF